MQQSLENFTHQSNENVCQISMILQSEIMMFWMSEQHSFHFYYIISINHEKR